MICPDTFDDLEDFISDVELVVELGMCSRLLNLCDIVRNLLRTKLPSLTDIEFHQGMKQMIISKLCCR
jgi:hypothetical protein